ncbi:MAG TPA: HAD family acid phosphatase [Sphingomicrobium sp.]
MKVARIAVVLASGSLLGGCVAAAIPPLASGMLVRKRMADKRAEVARESGPRVSIPMTDDKDQKWTILPGAGGLPAPDGTSPSSATTTGALPVAETRQYLFGSGESAGLSLQAYQALAGYLDSVKFRRKDTLRQVVLNDGSTLAAPYFEPCGEKPLAIVMDIDETAILNIGYEGNSSRRSLGFDDARWQRWEKTGAAKVVAVPGSKATVDAARKAGITVIFNSNRDAAYAKETAAALDHAGLGPAVHKTTLWLKGDDGGGSGKDTRRWAISGGYCVIALVGDQLGDFSDLFNDPTLKPAARRALAQSPGIAGLWGSGWFLLPNPVYGPGLKGNFDEVFPAETRWTDPLEAK